MKSSKTFSIGVNYRRNFTPLFQFNTLDRLNYLSSFPHHAVFATPYHRKNTVYRETPLVTKSREILSRTEFAGHRQGGVTGRLL